MQNKRKLVVSSHGPTQVNLAEFIGGEVETISTLAGARSIGESGWSDYELIVLEGSLSDGPGEHLAKEIRQSSPDTLIVAMDDDQCGRNNFRKLGCQHVCQPSEIEGVLRQVLATHSL